LQEEIEEVVEKDTEMPEALQYHRELQIIHRNRIGRD